MTRIGVIGAGGVGGTIGGLLAKAGEEVTLIDPWREHVTAIQERGLRIDAPQEEHNVRVKALHVDEIGKLDDKLDILFVSVKSYDTEWAVKKMLPHLHDDTWVISAQNSINEERIAPIVGSRRTMGCVVMLSTWLLEEAHIRHFGYLRQEGVVNFAIGELNGKDTPRAQEAVRLLSQVGAAKVTEDLWGERWAKMAINCMGNAGAGIVGPVGWGLRDHPKCANLRLRLAAEAVRVGRSLGYNVAPPVRGLTYEELEAAAEEAPPEGGYVNTAPPPADQGEPSLVQDLIKGRRTEVEYLNGYIADRGAAIGLSAPFSAAITSVMKGIESGEFQMGLESLDRVFALAEANKESSRW